MCDCEKVLNAKIEALEQLIDVKFTATQLAVDKAEEATRLRFESVNEFRAALSDQTKNFVNRDVIEGRFADMERRMGGVENRLSVLDGRVIGYSAGVGAVVLIIALIAQYLSFSG